MPVLLNPRYELFAQGLALGKKQDIAYADASYTKNKGNSSTLKNKPENQNRVQELLEERARVSLEKTWLKIEVTKNSLLAELEESVSLHLRKAKLALRLRPLSRRRASPAISSIGARLARLAHMMRSPMRNWCVRLRRKRAHWVLPDCDWSRTTTSEVVLGGAVGRRGALCWPCSSTIGCRLLRSLWGLKQTWSAFDPKRTWPPGIQPSRKWPNAARG